MAYSDYGGYAYRNGVRVVERSDCALPGALHGDATHHVVLGDGPVFVVLHKQDDLRVYRDGALVDIERFEPDAEFCEFVVGRHYVGAHREDTDNRYQYVRVTQPDGVVWTGFSGYGVGAGHELESYGYSTEKCVARLRELWP